jgi:predicted DNA-binding protein
MGELDIDDVCAGHPLALRQLAELIADKERLDWLASVKNDSAGVYLPREAVEQHIDSMRDAIDAAMRMEGDK